MPHIPRNPIQAAKSRTDRDRRQMIRQIKGIDLQVYSLLNNAAGGALGRGLSDAVFECMTALEGKPDGTQATARVSITFKRVFENGLPGFDITIASGADLPDQANLHIKP